MKFRHLFLLLVLGIACGKPSEKSSPPTPEVSPFISQYVAPLGTPLEMDTFDVADFFPPQKDHFQADSNFIALYLPDEIVSSPSGSTEIIGRFPSSHISLLVFANADEEIQSLSLINYDSTGHVLGLAILSDSIYIPFSEAKTIGIRSGAASFRLQHSFMTYKKAGKNEYLPGGRRTEIREIEMLPDGSFREKE